MKFIRRFNEELSPNVYRSAAKQLKKMGHHNRSEDLDKHADIISYKENLKKYSKYGKVKIDFYDEKVFVFSGDFYLFISFDESMCQECNTTNNGNWNDSEISIALTIGLIPADKNVIETCMEKLPEPDFYNGFYWGMFVSIDYKIVNEKMVFNGIDIDPYDESLSFSPVFADRISANTFKQMLLKCFDEEGNYPHDTSVGDMSTYSVLNSTLCQTMDLTINYNFDLSKAYEDIKGYSVNKLFKSR